MNPAFVLRNVSKRFIDGVHSKTVFAGVDLSVDRGSFICLVGPSGGGKSTLLSVVGLLQGISEGYFEFFGNDTSLWNAEQAAELRKRHVGFLFQDGGLVERMSALKNVELPLVYRKMSRRKRRDDATCALEELGLADIAEKVVDLLSGGERQRVALARALVSHPSLLVCDEPTASLDAVNADHVIRSLKTAAGQGTTVLCATHDTRLRVAADRSLRVRDGVVQACDAPV